MTGQAQETKRTGWPITRPGSKALTLHRLLVAILFIAIFTMAVRVPADTDTWWHLRSGQYIVENYTIPTTDPFSHTRADQLWIDHGWLAQIFWYVLYAVGGWAVVALVLAVLVTVAFWLVWRQISGNVFVGAAAMVIGAIVSSVIWVARPQMISFTLTSLVAYLLYRFKYQRRSLLPWLPLVMVLWVNIHGGFAIAFMLMAVYLAGEAANKLTRHQEEPVVDGPGLKHLLMTMIISLAVIVINPHTWRMWLYPFQTVGIGALRDYIQEWQSPDFHQAITWPFIIMLLLTLAAMGRAGRRADWTDLGLVALWTAWALFAARNIAIFGLVVTPVLARYGDLAWIRQWQDWGYQHVPFAWPAAANRSRYRLNWVLLALVVVAALIKISLPLTPSANLKAEREGLPYDAVQFIQRHNLPGPLFNSYNWGGYLIFKLWPDYPVYIDGRTDLYDDQFIREYLDIMAAQGNWAQALDSRGINLVLIESGSTLDQFLRLDSNWQEVYRDQKAVIFTRRVALAATLRPDRAAGQPGR